MANKGTAGDSGVDHIPAAAFSGVLRIRETEIDCFVLDDTRRVLSGRGIARALARKGGAAPRSAWQPPRPDTHAHGPRVGRRCTVAATAGARRLPRYKCATRRILPPDQHHPPVSVTAPKADEHLWRAVVALLADGTLLELVAHLRAAARHSGVQSRQQGLLRMVADGEARLAENLGLYHWGLLTEQVLERENRGLTVEVERARAELEAGREQLEAGARAEALARQVALHRDKRRDRLLALLSREL